jgi:hypothetical protein
MGVKKMWIVILWLIMPYCPVDLVVKMEVMLSSKMLVIMYSDQHEIVLSMSGRSKR